MSFGRASAQQLGPLLMRRWEHFSSRLAPHFPTMGLQGRTRCIVGAGGRELGQVSATLDISPRSWHPQCPIRTVCSPFSVEEEEEEYEGGMSRADLVQAHSQGTHAMT